MRALGDRPTALERWTTGVHEGIALATGRGDKSDAFYSKRVPKGAPEYVETTRVTFPSGRTAEEVCVSNLATVGWCAQMGTITFHPWPTRSGDNDHPDQLRIDLDPQPGTTFADAVRVAGVAGSWSRSSAWSASPRRQATAASTSTSGSSRAGASRTCATRRSASDASSRSVTTGVTTKWWKEERGERIFVDFNQNNRDRTIASAYSLRPLPGAPVSMPLTWDDLAQVEDPREFNLHTAPERFADRGDAMAAINDVACDLQPLIDLYDASPEGETNFPPDYPKMPGEPPRVQPSKKVAAHWDKDGNRIES